MAVSAIGSNSCRLPTPSRGKIDRPPNRPRLDGGRHSKAARSRYGQETEVRAEINPKTGEIRFPACFSSSSNRERCHANHGHEARKKTPRHRLATGSRNLAAFDFGRIAAQSAKQVIVQKVREAERDRQYQEYKDGSAISSTAS